MCLIRWSGWIFPWYVYLACLTKLTNPHFHRGRNTGATAVVKQVAAVGTQSQSDGAGSGTRQERRQPMIRRTVVMHRSLHRRSVTRHKQSSHLAPPLVTYLPATSIFASNTHEISPHRLRPETSLCHKLMCHSRRRPASASNQLLHLVSHTRVENPAQRRRHALGIMSQGQRFPKIICFARWGYGSSTSYYGGFS